MIKWGTYVLNSNWKASILTLMSRISNRFNRLLKERQGEWHHPIRHNNEIFQIVHRDSPSFNRRHDWVRKILKKAIPNSRKIIRNMKMNRIITHSIILNLPRVHFPREILKFYNTSKMIITPSLNIVLKYFIFNERRKKGMEDGREGGDSLSESK